MNTATAYDPATNGPVRALPALDRPGGEAAPGGEPAEPRLVRQLDRLARLGEIGMELAEGLARGAAGRESDGDAPGFQAACLAFTRIARAIRQINAQEQEILGLRDEKRREARRERAEAEEIAAEERKAEVRRQVVDRVRDLLDADEEVDRDERDDLLADIGRDYDDYYDFYRGSFDEIVGRVRRDLGLAEARPKRARAKSKPKPKPARAKRAREPKPGEGGDAPDTSDDPDDEIWRRPYVPRTHGRDPP